MKRIQPETKNDRTKSSQQDLQKKFRQSQRRVAQLEESEQKFRHLFEHSPAMVYLSDIDGTILDINDAGVRMLGYETREEVLGLESSRSLYTDPENRNRFLESISRQGSVREFETQMRRRDGAVIDVSITSTVRRDKSGNIEGYEGFVLDVTDKKRAEKALVDSEEKYRTVVDNSLAGILVHQNSIFRYMNHRLAGMLGYEHPDELIGHPFWEVIHPEDRETVKQRGIRRQKKQFHPNQYIFRALRRDGSVIWVELWGSPALFLGKSAVVCIVIDITQSKQAEDEIRHLSRRLIDVIEEERKRLAADLHDEFGQILTSLRFDLEILESSLVEESGSHVERCRTQIRRVERLAELVRKTTSYLRPDALDHFGLIPTMEWHIQDFLSHRSDLGIEFQAAGFKRRLKGSIEIVLYRIFQECLTNIAKHAKARKVNIILTHSHPTVILIVKDDGVGFDSGEGGLPPGSPRGIGLLSMRERVASLEGTIDIASSPGRGLTIRVEVPADWRES